ncbi:sulfotransferase domain-containing protein [Candidatus Nitrotoga sp. 1052]|uniref:sulfotransferase domain-containing protein n=1 Tax=Candidatus Nitrotoga sp. 1052 TaxID=2886964 RepID=UPI001EF6B631|nr:sulfotransferase domain-containing protein [Candidatus Nitrotoga sp. 1052]CAH1077466.1 Sulfotransferase domain-containing protein [Candidatus Nitrotoga sp. 1052]
MHISEFGPATIFVENFINIQPNQPSNMWFLGTGFNNSTVVCINNRILTKTVISLDGTLATVEVPQDILTLEQQLYIFLIDTRTDVRSNIVEAMVTFIGPKKVFFSEAPSTLAARGRHILISCFPKSGSTLLLKSLCKITGFQNWPMVFEYGGNEQDLFLPSIIDAYSMDTITQQHVRATDTNLRLIKNYGFKVVILTRNIFDTLISLHDHLLSESLDMPMGYLNENYRTLTFEQRLDFLVDVVTPWYLNFYASWSQVNTYLDSNDFLWITYDELINDKNGTIFQLLSKFGFYDDKEKVLGSLAELKSEDTRLNVGISGRGRRMLNDCQKKRIFEIAQRYPDIDFSLILN